MLLCALEKYKMEIYKRVIEILDANVILCLIPILLTLKLIELFFKNRFETRKALNLIRWIIIVYTMVTFTFYLIGMIMNPDAYAFIHRATGPYAWAYWILFLSSLILPLSLFFKKLASKFWYVLLAAFCMKSGVYFERFVIITTRFHRDYLTESENAGFMDSLSFGIGLVFLQGVLLAILILGIFEIIKRKKTKHKTV